LLDKLLIKPLGWMDGWIDNLNNNILRIDTIITHYTLKLVQIRCIDKKDILQ